MNVRKGLPPPVYYKTWSTTWTGSSTACMELLSWRSCRIVLALVVYLLSYGSCRAFIFTELLTWWFRHESLVIDISSLNATTQGHAGSSRRNKSMSKIIHSCLSISIVATQLVSEHSRATHAGIAHILIPGYKNRRFLQISFRRYNGSFVDELVVVLPTFQ